MRVAGCGGGCLVTPGDRAAVVLLGLLGELLLKVAQCCVLSRQARGFAGPRGLCGVQRLADLLTGHLDMGMHVLALGGRGENAVDTGGGGIESMKVQIRDDLEVVEHDLLVRSGVRAAGQLNQC
jgi:hypothetical protein